MDSLVEFLDQFDKDPAIAALLPAARDELLRAEITRLTAEVERLTIKGTHTCSDQCQRVTCVLRRDNGRLTVELARLKGLLEPTEANVERVARVFAITRNVDPDEAIDCFGNKAWTWYQSEASAALTAMGDV
jgi:hypothetical protein